MTDFTINIDNAVDFLTGLLNTPSPTGYTHEAIEYVENAFKALTLPPGTIIERTKRGALMLRIPGKASDAPVGLTAHIDTLGLMVTEIKSNGRLKCTNVGGIMWNGIENEGVTVRTHDNTRIRGSVVPVNGSAHVNRNVHSMERNADNLEIRLDIRTTNADETREAGIGVGDFVLLDPRVEVSEAGFIRSRFLDDKLSVACIYAALEALDGEAPAQDTEILISNYEEVGHGGADGWRNDLFELIPVDMAAIGNGLTSDEFHCTICVKDSGGPYSFETNNRLRRIAGEVGIEAKVDIYPYYSSDGSAYWRAGGRARVGLIGPGVDLSHSYERTHTDSIRDTALLIAGYLCDY